MRSIELGWLAKGDKSLFLPELVFAEIPTGGCYHAPEHGVNEEYGCDARKGIIVVSTLYGSEVVAATLAHEWRHHWQWWSGIKFDYVPWIGEEDYDSELRAYFKRSSTERDALRFEMKKAQAPHHDEWMSILQGCL